MTKFTTVDLFCGAGGFTEGFRKSGIFTTILAVDFDKQACDTFQYNHPEVTTICSDVSSIDREQLLELTEKKQVDVVIGGPPCQGFSLAGLRMPDDPKNKLFKEFVRVVNELKPKIFVFENVSGIVSMQKGMVLDAICSEFKSIGYEISYSILNSAEFGVPQARPRFIMIGMSGGGKINMPNPTHYVDNNPKIDLFSEPKSQYVSVLDAFSNLPVLAQGQGSEEMENLVPNNDYQHAVFGSRNPGKLYNHRATRHNENIVKRYSVMPQGGDIKSLPIELRTKKNNVFRLPESLPARTITCNFRTDIIHPWQPRGLTTREAARLQSFDDDYQFFGNLTRKARYLTQDDQVGNAVPPLLAKAIAMHIKDYL